MTASDHPLPSQGGSYVRQPDGQLFLVVRTSNHHEPGRDAATDDAAQQPTKPTKGAKPASKEA